MRKTTAILATISLGALIVLGSFVFTASVLTKNVSAQTIAAVEPNCAKTPNDPQCTIANSADSAVCASNPKATGCTGSQNSDCSNGPGPNCDDIIVGIVLPAINFLSAGVGVIVTAMIIIGGIQYAASGGDPQAVASARKKIINALLALVAFGLLWAVINWIAPGGVLNGII